jgi:predicted nuclease with TOPRIM domain
MIFIIKIRKNMKQKIQLSESQLCNLIKESVRKAIMNEIGNGTLEKAMDRSENLYRRMEGINEKFEELVDDLSSMSAFDPNSTAVPKNKEIEDITYELSRLYERFKRLYARKQTQYDNFQDEFQKANLE